jgi:hypothetical protein
LEKLWGERDEAAAAAAATVVSSLFIDISRFDVATSEDHDA